MSADKYFIVQDYEAIKEHFIAKGENHLVGDVAIAIMAGFVQLSRDINDMPVTYVDTEKLAEAILSLRSYLMEKK
jgi:hypothetical protein